MKHLVRGSDYLAQHPGFVLKGRDWDLERISSILMRRKANSLLVVGPSGVGISALILGLQSCKSNPNTPFDIVSKRLFFLDTDSLFASGDSALINEDFQKTLKVMNRTSESILVIEDTFGFVEASQMSGNSHFINAMNVAVKNDNTQVILQVRDENLSQVLKWHSDFHEAYTLYDVREPIGEMLYEIVDSAAVELTEHHGIKIDPDAIRDTIVLTSKYRDGMGLGGAQPSRSISLLDRALSSYRRKAHGKHPIIADLEAKVAASGGVERVGHEAALLAWSQDWQNLQEVIRKTYRMQRDGEEAISSLQDEKEEIKTERDRRARDAEKHASSANAAVQVRSFSEMAAVGGFESPEEQEITARISQIEKVVTENGAEHRRLIGIANRDLLLTPREIRLEFSEISGISADKLGEDEMEVLRNLESNLLANIFDQDHVVRHVANAVKVAKVDGMEESGPRGSFLFLGPSGVGKTEMAKRLAAELGVELVRFDMSEYMEKHAVAKLIGAPPGYEGFEAGGILTNTIRKKPVCVCLFDEIEKAHPDIYNIFLQILSDARLTDNIGRPVDFSEVYIVMTSNIGQPFYLDMSLTDDEAQERATVELNATYRSEFLNRFNGRENILHFRRLSQGAIQRIISREINKLKKAYEPRGMRISIADGSVESFCIAHYDPTKGARGLPGYLKANLRPIMANQILATPDATGLFDIRFNPGTSNFEVEFRKD